LLAVRLTDVDVPVTVPTPWSIDRLSAFMTCQPSVDEPPPAGSTAGVAVNDTITGRPDGAVPPPPAVPLPAPPP
jgi:hypothetical protein